MKELLYAICPMEHVPIGGAAAFVLAEIDHQGRQSPLRIVIVRPAATDYRCFENTCPHEGAWLNIRDGHFFDPSGKRLRCGKHGSLFALDDGICVSGQCEGKQLRRIKATTYQGDICISGVRLQEDDRAPAIADDTTLEITISPE